MITRLTKILQRSLLAVILFAIIGILSHLNAESQGLQSHPSIIASPSPQTRTVQPTILAVESIGMTVSDMERAVDFYTQVLSFKKVSDVEVLGAEYEHLQGLFGVRLRIVKLQLGNEFIELTEYLTPKGRPIPVDSRSNDRWFQHIAIAVSNMDNAYQQLRRFNVQHASTAPQRIPDSNQAAAGIRAFYFKDPDGHFLEAIYFPAGKGDPKWQTPINQLFLGIDHTAIVVSNTNSSLRFYRDMLGLTVAGESVNSGTEQAHLNNVQGARLHISGLRSPAGPGIELLDYLEPTDGRSLPADAKPNDLLHWQTTLVVKNIAAIAEQLQRHQSTILSSEIATIPEPALGFKRGMLVRDPDGHPMRLVEK